MRNRPVGRVEDYTNAFLVSAGFSLFWVLMLVAALWGWLGVALLSAAIDRGIARLGR
ncbi:MAG: hypothetical protein JXQ91_13975 [Vannielia sp.]|uniref:hypothetical protein n=1 Tax=Vannielia sp. TaxID=2813045 RepID=UPI003B8D2C05